ncbi:MAG: gluconate 2-dehydrogenase subunit 3 family protein [Pseudomonadales bacterium]|nr:gluconate 2-dehydrogenase subunit 3 family protein [Pseudomonadales bacterium]
MTINRREFIKRGLGGATLALAFEIGGGSLLLTPQQARAQAVPLQQLTADEAAVLERLAEALLPGAAEAGVTHFIDHQLGEDPGDCLLIAKYFQVRPPYRDFYRQGVAGCEQLAQEQFKQKAAKLNVAQLDQLIKMIGKPGTRTPEGYDLSLFYLCLRSDAVDVVYGTPEGFERLNVPYMAHIMPPEGWNG